MLITDEAAIKMSFVDLATLALHRRNEMEARIKVFVDKCDHAINDITKLKQQAQGFVNQLNCEPADLKERFLNCMKQLDEYIYLMTDFNLSVGKIEETAGMEYTPVQDTSVKSLPVAMPHTFNILDVLSEPRPTAPPSCTNNCPPTVEKPKSRKVPKDEQTLIVFSSASCSSESVPNVPVKNEVETQEKEIQCELPADVIETPTKEIALLKLESCNLPAQTILNTDQVYPATIISFDGGSFWIITDNVNDVCNLMFEMTSFYKRNRIEMSLEDINNLTYCAFYDDESDCYYRGLFIRLTEEVAEGAEVFLVDTGEVRMVTFPVTHLQPLSARFCSQPPYARCCHLAGVEMMCFTNKEMIDKQENFVRPYVGTHCSVEVDDNSSESLGVYIIVSENLTLNELFVKNGLALPTDAPTPGPRASSTPGPSYGPPELAELSDEDNHAIDAGPEYEDPVEAVTGYSCRDDMDICKHYKAGAETCFKGARCKKKHIMKHPDGWTLDRVEVVGKCKSVPLPMPGTWLKVLVTYVAHFDRLYVQIVDENKTETELPSFGVVLPPATLDALVVDMNSPAARIAYKPLTIAPAVGELVVALYPPDDQWYRARVLSVTRADQSLEVMYIDYGNVVWVKENAIRELEPRHTLLPAQAVRCALAGVAARSHDSRQWAEAKQQLARLAQDRTFKAHVIARDYDEITVELYDNEGYSIAEQLVAVTTALELQEYSVIDDTNVTQKLVVP